MLIEMAVGDAYGFGWEFAPGQTAPNDLSSFHANPSHPEFPVGRYTDDTMRAIANAHVVLSGEDQWFRPAAYVRAYQRAYEADPRPGWSRGFQEYLRANHGSPPEAFMRGLRRRPTNGAVMGVATLGYLPDAGSVRTAALCQCVSTHSGDAGAAAQTIALAAHYLLRRIGPKSAIAGYLADQVDWASDAQRREILCEGTAALPVPAMPAWTIAAGTVWALVEFDSLSEMLRWSIDRSGDTDSLGAVTMAIASCSREVAQDLPQGLLETVEDANGRWIMSRLQERLDSLAKGIDA